MKALKFFFAFLAISANINAQQNYRNVQFTQANGLPQNSINSLYFTPGGFLWLATEGGLVRFNGQKFKVFNKQNVAKIEDDRIKFIISDVAGNIYAQDSKGEVLQIKENTLSYFNKGRYSYPIRGVLPGAYPLEDSVHAGSERSIRNRILLNPIQIISKAENQYAVLGKNYIYSIHKNGHIDSIELNISPLYYFTSNAVEYILDRNKTLYRLDKSTIGPSLTLVYAFGNKIANTQLIHKYTTGKTYLIQDNTLSEVNLAIKDHVEIIPILYNLPANDDVSDIDCFNDIIAIGTLSNGLYIYKQNHFETLLPPERENRSVTPFYAIDSDNKGNIYSAKGHIFQTNGYRNVLFNRGSISPEILKIVGDTTIYFAFGDSVFSYSLNTRKQIFLYNTGAEDIISAMEVKTDRIYVSGSKEIIMISSGKVVAKYPFEIKLTQRINHIYVSPNTEIYAGGCDGLFAADKKINKMVNISPQNDFCVRQVSLLNDVLVVCTYGSGIWLKNKGKWTQLPNDDNNAIAKAHTLVCDAKGRIWISTNNGIIQTTLVAITSFINQTTSSISYRKFDHHDGIVNSEFNGGCQPAYILDTYGRIAFPSMYGVVRFHPDSIATYHPSKIYIDAITLDGNLYPTLDSIIHIPSGATNLTIDLTWPNWSNPTSITASYYLTKHDPNPSNISGSTASIIYNNLSTGTYPLMVQLIFNGLDKIEHSMQLQLEVESAFYETLWFRLLLLVSASGFIFLIIQAYTFYLRRQNQQLEHQVSLRTQELDKMNQTLSAYNLQLIASEKELKQSISLKNRLISIITHDIITPLRFIAMVARNTEADTKQDELLLTLNDIHHTSIRLHDNAQNILNWIKHQTSKIEVSRTNVPLFAIVEEITELLKEPSQSVNVELINNIELDKLIITDRNILSIMLHNIVSNAVKYTRNSTVNIGSTDSNGFTDITISDNGSGIQQSMLQRIKKVLNREQSYFIDDTSGGHGLGFIIISELSQLIGATVEIQSSSEGTTVIFKIPTTN